jgi:hypothetical protein
MAKSIIAGEYLLQIADSGHVDVVRVFRNAYQTMKDIAAENNFEVEEKWNTQTLGSKLVKQFGDGKIAKFKDIIINKTDSGKIEIYQECKNTVATLRAIAQQMGFEYDDNWNTRSFGAKLLAFLEEHKAEADKLLQTPNAKPAAKEETKAEEQPAKDAPAEMKPKKNYKVIVKNPMVASVELSMFTDDDAVRDGLENGFEDLDEDEECLDEWWLNDHGYLDNAVHSEPVIISCDGIEVYEEDQLIQTISMEEKLQEAIEDDYCDTEGIIYTFLYNNERDEDSLTWVAIKKAVPAKDIELTFKSRNYNADSELPMRFFDAFGLKGYAIDYYPCGDRDENVILGGSDVEKVLIVEGTTLNVLWDD